MELTTDTRILLSTIITEFFKRKQFINLVSVKFENSNLKILIKSNFLNPNELKLLARELYIYDFNIVLGWEYINISIFKNQLLELNFEVYKS